MKNVLLCAYDPMLVKNLYGILRQDGFEVEVADHMASALRMITLKEYGAVVMDRWPFGIAAEDAVQVMRAMAPQLYVLVLGKVPSSGGVVSVEEPADLETLRKIIRVISGIGDTEMRKASVTGGQASKS